MLLKSDNATVVVYVNRDKIPCVDTIELWHQCLQWHIHRRAQTLICNFMTNFRSRHLRDKSVNQELFSMINSTLNPLEIDLFATRFYTHLVSWHPVPMAEATDTFLQDWSTFTGYAHLHWCLISRARLDHTWQRWW